MRHRYGGGVLKFFAKPIAVNGRHRKRKGLIFLVQIGYAMPTYEYVAWDAAGACKQGVKTADSEEAILSLLREESLTPVSIAEVAVQDGQHKGRISGKRIKSQDLSAFCWQLGTMIGGGLPITTAIFTIADEMPNKSLEHICKDIAARLEQGQTLTEAVTLYEKVFGRLGCAMIMAGESSGSLTLALGRLAEYYENRDKLIRKVRGAMAYPMFVVGFIIVIIIAMMTLIIPRFTQMFAELGDKLPAFTRGFMAVYDTLMSNVPLILIAVTVSAVGLIAFSKTRSGHRKLSAFVLKIPIFGKIVQMAFVATFCKTLGTLVSSGVSVIDAFTILSTMSSNEVLVEGVQETRERLIKGMPIAKSMEATGLFPGVAVKMVHIGEESGSLAAVLDKTSDYYARKVELLIGSLLGLLEPILIVSVGAIVLVVLLAMYMPIFSMSA